MAAPVLWNALDEATKVAERHLQEDAREWWLKMGHTAQVPAKLPPCVVSSTSMHTYAWGPFAKSGSMQDIQQSFGLKALNRV